MKRDTDGQFDRGRRAKRRSGIALVSVLWVVTLLSLMAATFSRTTRTDVNLARNQIENAQAEALADAGVHRAIMGLAALAPELSWRADGSVYEWSFGDGEIRISVWDEGGKIDLNTADDAILQNLFVAVGVDTQDASALLDAIVDYRDGNSLRRLNGAEDDDYRLAGLAHGAKDAPFEVLDELRQVFGMTPALFDRVRPALTVHARLRRPFELTASPLVQAAVQGTVLEENGPEEAQEGPIILESADVLVAPGEEGADEPAADTPVGVQGGLAPRSRVRTFSIHAEAKTRSGASFARDAVVRLDTGGELPYEILAWGLGRRALFVQDAEAPEDN